MASLTASNAAAYSHHQVLRATVHRLTYTIQVAISRRVQRYKLALRGRQDAENRRTRSTSDQSTPMIWGWSVDAS
ncbi:unnamed protein product [Ectocarpus sp. CCAP 1310/34]|nr:unnamed protein product [Ectocarpus sp. CCAP 1310/34]